MFYGWKLLAALCGIYFLTTGSVYYGFSVILPAMIVDLNWTRTEGSLGYSLLFLIPGLSGPLIAWLVGRLGPRATMTIGGLLIATGAISIYFMTSLTQYYLSIGGLVGIGVAMQTVIPGTQVITNWFAGRRALALGLFMAMGGAGAFVAAPGFSYILEATGEWRIAWLVMAGATLTSSLLAITLVRNQPEDMNSTIDGIVISENDLDVVDSPAGNAESEAEKDNLTPPTRVYQTLTSWTLRDAIRTTPFWLIIAAASLVVVGQTMVSSQGMIHMTDLGLPAVTASAVLGTVGMLSACGRLATGFLGDTFDPRYMLAGGLLIELLAMSMFNYVDTAVLAYGFAIAFGAGNGLAIVAGPALVANYFGKENYAAMLGIRGLVITPVAAAGPLVAARTFEIAGSYEPVFIGFAFLAMVPVITIILMRPPLPGVAKQN